MRAFGLASVFIILLAIVGRFGLDFIQESSSTAYSTNGTRLDRAEAVNDYGRQVIPD